MQVVGSLTYTRGESQIVSKFGFCLFVSGERKVRFEQLKQQERLVKKHNQFA